MGLTQGGFEVETKIPTSPTEVKAATKLISVGTVSNFPAWKRQKTRVELFYLTDHYTVTIHCLKLCLSVGNRRVICCKFIAK